MGKILLATLIAIGFAASASAATFELDPTHTRIGFGVKHMVISTVQGHFDKFKGAFDMNEKGILSKADASIETESVNTQEPKRDDHLRSPEFFDAKKYPEIKFVSTKVTQEGNNITIIGNLTIKDVTKPVTLTGEYFGQAKGMKGEIRAGFHMEGKINRKDYGVSFHKLLETGGLVVGDDVKITLDVEGVEKK